MDYRIVCTIQDQPTYHNHILGVETGDFPRWPTLRWSVEEVRQYILSGHASTPSAHLRAPWPMSNASIALVA